MRTNKATDELFWEKVDKSGDCWIWTAYIKSDGYGQFGVRRRLVGAHRYAYETQVGPIPEGMHIDHACRNRACVNPDHLRVVTNAQNAQNRGGTPRGKNPYRGVYPSPPGSWIARYRLHGRNYYLGRFATAEEANEVVRAARARAFPFDESVADLRNQEVSDE